jgi:hypothetical protein
VRYSKVDQLIFDDGWKGIVTRILLVSGAYFGILYLPDMDNWGVRPLALALRIGKAVEKS